MLRQLACLMDGDISNITLPCNEDQGVEAIWSVVRTQEAPYRILLQRFDWLECSVADIVEQLD
jgi:hypothetical protein